MSFGQCPRLGRLRLAGAFALVSVLGFTRPNAAETIEPRRQVVPDHPDAFAAFPDVSTATVFADISSSAASPGAAIPAVSPGAAVPAASPGAAVPAASPGAAVPAASPGAAIPAASPGAAIPAASPGAAIPAASPGAAVPAASPVAAASVEHSRAEVPAAAAVMLPVAAMPALPLGGPHPVVVPPYRARIRAAHRLHAEQAKMACLECHPKAKSSAHATDWLGPDAATCDRCHGLNHRQLRVEDRLTDVACQRCHVAAAVGRAPGSHLRNSHAGHARRNIGCPQCHGRVASLPDALGSERLPKKPRCVRCHAGRGRLDGDARSDCTVCHEADGGQMRTRFGGKTLTPSSRTPSLEHSNDWLFRHGDVAGNDPGRCQGCHSTRQCQACHDGRLRPRNIHPGDWLSTHAVASKQEGDGCNSCHRQQSFCLSCHQRLGLGSSGAPANMASRGALHPPASIWTTGPTGPQHHGTQARRNLSECASCHQERDCVRCHASAGVGGLGGSMSSGSGLSPHPPDFTSRCTSYWSANPRPCLTCHRPDSQELLRCR